MSMAETTQQPTIDLHKKSISNTATTREKNNDGCIGLESIPYRRRAQALFIRSRRVLDMVWDRQSKALKMLPTMLSFY
jgi:hypothetical protein